MLAEEKKFQKIGWSKIKSASNVKTIFIASNDINILVCTNMFDNIDAVIMYEGVIAGGANRQYCQESNELEIKEAYEGPLDRSKLTLVIKLPADGKFDKVSITTNSAKIRVEKDVLPKRLEINTFLGDVELLSSPKKTTVFSKSGNVNIDIEAVQNFDMKVITVSGKLTARLSNVRYLQANVQGRQEFFTKEEGVCATLKVETIHGGVEIE